MTTTQRNISISPEAAKILDQAKKDGINISKWANDRILIDFQSISSINDKIQSYENEITELKKDLVLREKHASMEEKMGSFDNDKLIHASLDWWKARIEENNGIEAHHKFMFRFHKHISFEKFDIIYTLAKKIIKEEDENATAK